MELLAPLALALFGGIYAFRLHRRTAELRAIGTRERPWTELDRAKRRAIGRSINRGEAVDDPADAPAAVAMIDAASRFRDVLRAKPFDWVLELAMIGSLVAALVTVGSPPPVTVAAVVLFFTLLAFQAAWQLGEPRRRARYARARAANEQLLSRE